MAMFLPQAPYNGSKDRTADGDKIAVQYVCAQLLSISHLSSTSGDWSNLSRTRRKPSMARHAHNRGYRRH